MATLDKGLTMTLTQWNIFSYTDSIEILIISYGLYRFSSWISKDKTKNLLSPFYNYIMLIIVSSLLHMHTIHTLSLLYAPVACCLFFIMHQKTLQKNIITPHRSYSHKEDVLNRTWIETLIQGCVMHFNAGKDILILIEKHDMIASYMRTYDALYAPLTKALLSLIMESNDIDHHKLLWINTTGKLIALNADLVISAEITDDPHYYNLPEWKQKALCLTKNTDTIIIKASHASRSFDVVVESKVYEDLNTQNITTLLEYYTRSDAAGERYTYGIEHKKLSEHQSHS